MVWWRGHCETAVAAYCRIGPNQTWVEARGKRTKKKKKKRRKKEEKKEEKEGKEEEKEEKEEEVEIPSPISEVPLIHSLPFGQPQRAAKHGAPPVACGLLIQVSRL